MWVWQVGVECACGRCVCSVGVEKKGFTIGEGKGRERRIGVGML